MQRFLRDNFALSYTFPEEFKKELSSVPIYDRVAGSVSDTLTPIQFALPSKHKRSVFDIESLDVLKCLYCKINPSCSITDVIVNSVFPEVRFIDSKR